MGLLSEYLQAFGLLLHIDSEAKRFSRDCTTAQGIQKRPEYVDPLTFHSSGLIYLLLALDHSLWKQRMLLRQHGSTGLWRGTVSKYGNTSLLVSNTTLITSISRVCNTSPECSSLTYGSFYPSVNSPSPLEATQAAQLKPQGLTPQDGSSPSMTHLPKGPSLPSDSFQITLIPL